MKGIDVSSWNHTLNADGSLTYKIDWKKAKAAGVEFVIVKAIDKKNQKEIGFDHNYAGAVSIAAPVDVYNYLYTVTEAQARAAAKALLSVIKGKKVNKVYADVEDKCLQGIGIKLINIINTYKEVIEEAGYKCEVYTGLAFYNSYIRPYASQIDCKFWIARYNKGDTIMDFKEMPLESKRPDIVHELSGWQYTSHGKVDGINGNVDLNIMYEETASLEREKFPVLRKGSKGYYVGYVQEKLNSLGYNCGAVDKDFGSNTKLAVEDFQSRNGLTVDGVVGPKTWQKLLADPVRNPVVEYSLKKDGSKKISANFTAKEFACKDGSDKILVDAEFVADKLQKIRNHFGVPVTFNSAYRTQKYNDSLPDSSKNSYHVKGQAFDIVVKGKTPAEVAAYAYSIGIPGIIQYNTFVHVDSRVVKYYARNDNGRVTKVSKF